MCRRNRLLLTALLLLPPAAAIAQNNCPHPAAVPQSPANGAKGVTSPVTFTWGAVPAALGYEVWASEGGGEFDVIGGTSDTQIVEDMPPETEVEWYVVTNFADCKNQSVHVKFTTSVCANASAVLITPPNNANTSSPVEFSWTDVPNAMGYRVWFAEGDGDFQVLDETDGATESSRRLPPGRYVWFVESFFAECDSTFSTLGSFTIPRALNCSGAAPTLLSPGNNSQQTTSVHFVWSAVTGAIGYAVFASIDDSDFQFIDATDGATSIDADLGTGHVVWVVIAQFNGCDDTLSAFGEFDIPYNPACDHNSPLLISPEDGDRDVPTKLDFIWTPVPEAVGYEVWAAFNHEPPHMLGSSTETRLTATVPANVEVDWTVVTRFANCPSDVAPDSSFHSNNGSNVCRTPKAPDLFVDGEAMSGQSYSIIWSPGPGTASYEVQESTGSSFNDVAPKTTTTTGVVATFSHTVSAPTRFFYRVRSLSNCGAGSGPYSSVESIVILPDTSSESDAGAVGAYGARTVVQRVHVAGGSAPQSFTATVDKPWLTITPSSGTLPPEGIDFELTARTGDLPIGTSNATITVITSATASGGGRFAPRDGTTKSVPISVSMVTPVSSNAGNAPIPQSLIIPAVAHAQGAGATFESDIRIANAGVQVMKYLLTFTPTASDGTKVGQQAIIQVDPGETAALADVLKNFFGFAAPGDSISGVLEIRPVVAGGGPIPSTTFASSRTFALTANGTFGQFIPAIPFARFIGQTKDPAKPAVLSLQQVAQSAKYRTNLGIVEASGEPAKVQIDVFGGSGVRLGTYSIDLKGGEHRQLGNFLASKGLAVDDGRIQLSVISATGKISGYASVLDNQTNDPMLVLPVNPNEQSASRFILPGIADLNNGFASWRSDVRLFNGGTTSADATLTFYPQNNPGGAKSVSLSLPAGQVKAVDGVLQSLFSMTNAGGSLVITTPTSAKVVATARTYNQTPDGTYGQFIPGVTTADGVGTGDRALQILQVEESPRFRTNIGIVELTGNPVTVEISAFSPDSKVAAKTRFDLAGNQFTQINSVLRAAFGLPTTYNARISLRVVSGGGRVTGYASLIDNQTQDPTYVPAQ
jgi:hypothetical protein